MYLQYRKVVKMLNTWLHKDSQILQLTRMPHFFAVVIFWSAPSSPASEYSLTINWLTESRKTVRPGRNAQLALRQLRKVRSWSQIKQQQKLGLLPLCTVVFHGCTQFKIHVDSSKHILTFAFAKRKKKTINIKWIATAQLDVKICHAQCINAHRRCSVVKDFCGCFDL